MYYYSTSKTSWLIAESDTLPVKMPRWTNPAKGRFSLSYDEKKKRINVSTPTPMTQQTAWILLAHMTHHAEWADYTLGFYRHDLPNLVLESSAYVAGPNGALSVVTDWWLNGLISRLDKTSMTDWINDYLNDCGYCGTVEFETFCLLMAETVNEDWTPDPWLIRMQTHIRRLMDSYMRFQMNTVLSLIRDLHTWK